MFKDASLKIYSKWEECKPFFLILFRVSKIEILDLSVKPHSLILLFSIGGSSTVVMPPWEGPSRLNDDVAGQVRELEEKKKSFKETLDQFESERGRVEIALVLFTQQTKAGEVSTFHKFIDEEEC